MRTFKITNGDLVFNNSMDLMMVEEIDEIAQGLKITLSTNINEWFLNILHGLDYDAIQGKGKNIYDIELTIREAIMQEDRITDIVYLKVELDRESRHLIVNLKAVTLDLGVVELGEVIDIG